MKLFLRYSCIALPLAALLCTLNLSAATLTIRMATEISESGGSLAGSGEVTATYGDGSGSVDLALDLTGRADQKDFITAIDLNLAGSNSAGFDNTPSDAEIDGFATGFDALQVSGGGQCDVRVHFNTWNAPSSGRPAAGENTILTIVYPGLTVDFFDATSAHRTWTAVVRAR